jgi:hypothetical protein
MLAILKKGDADFVRQKFREILDVFRVRHLQHVQEAQDKELAVASTGLQPTKVMVQPSMS